MVGVILLRIMQIAVTPVDMAHRLASQTQYGRPVELAAARFQPETFLFETQTHVKRLVIYLSCAQITQSQHFAP